MNKRYNVVFTGNFQYPKGFAGTRRIQNLIDFLSQNTHSTHVLLLNNLEENGRKGSFKSTTFYTLFPFIKPIFRLSFIPFVAPLAFIKLHQYKREDKKNILYIYSGVNIENVFLALLGKILGYKLMVDVVEDFNLNQEKVTFWRHIKNNSNILFEKRLRGYVDGLIVITDYLKDKHCNLGFSEQRVFKMPITAWPRQYIESKNTSIKILYSGTYGKKDGVYFLLEAFEQLVAENKNIKLVLTGNAKNEIVERTKKSSKYIEFTGYLDDTEYYNYLDKCDIFCMTRINSSYANAGFPFKVGEYLATGKPTVVTRVSEIDKYLKHQESAIIVKPENSAEIQKGLQYLIDNPERAKYIGQRGREVLCEQFHPEIVGRNVVDFWNSII